MLVAGALGPQARRRATGATIVEAVVGDGTGPLHVVFFNQPWRERQLAAGHSRSPCSARSTLYRGKLQMTNPVVDLIGDRTGRIVPIYPQCEKAQLIDVGARRLGRGRRSSGAGRGASPTRCRAPCAGGYGLIDRGAAPATTSTCRVDRRQGRRPRRRLAFDELLRVQLALVLRKRAIGARRRRGSRHDGRRRARARAFHAALPLPAHRRPSSASIDEIDADLAAPHPMHRLLQGDVGSGKTVVAVDARCSAAVQGGHQGALMAPTEVLAEQHCRRHRARCSPASTCPTTGDAVRRAAARASSCSPTGSPAPSGERVARPGCADGAVDLVDRHPRADPGAVRVPQPRRRGDRRAAPLRRRAAGRAARRRPARRVPDVLVMTATPIPRTAAMTVYGDLDVSVLDELPPGRTPIVTDAGPAGPLAEAARPWDAGARRGRGRPPGLRRVPADRGEREARGGLGRGDLRPAAGRRAGRAAARPAARADAAGREGGGDGARSAPASSTCSSPRPSSRSASTSPTRR